MDKSMVCPLMWYERELISKEVGKNPTIFCEDKYPVNLLVKLQHYGIPTRLLDVTYNSLVALYFACIEDKDKDGEVIVFKIFNEDNNFIRYYNDEYVNIIARMHDLQHNVPHLVYPCDFEDFLMRIDYDTYKPTIEFGNFSVEAHWKTVAKCLKDPFFISPVELSERQKRQQGAFIIFPNMLEERNFDNESRYYISNGINELQKDSKLIEKIIIIPKDKKLQFLNYLVNYGITEEFLFPDNPDIICKTIKESKKKRLINS